MSEDLANDIQLPDELTVLKQRAKMMGLDFSNNIGLETLRQRVRDAQDGKKPGAEQPAEAEVNPLEPAKPNPRMSERKQQQMEQLKLIRCRITNMDPKKKELPGEIFTVANEYIGTVRKFIPYGENSEDGFHIPYCLYVLLDGKKFQQIRTTKNKQTGQIKIHTSWLKEFALEILPQLTQAEIDNLKKAQLAADRLADRD